jgi:inhibitor of cysteine peptidase
MHMSTLILTQDNNGEAVEVSKDDLISIRLPENPTTGFQWAVEEIKSSIITLEKSNYAPTLDTGVGGGGERMLIFRATSSGTTNLSLKLWQAWEGDSSIVAIFTITVHVHD